MTNDLTIWALVYMYDDEWEGKVPRIKHWEQSLVKLAEWAEKNYGTSPCYKIVQLKIAFKVNNKLELEIVSPNTN